MLIKVTIQTSAIISEREEMLEIDDDDLKGLNREQRKAFIDEAARELAACYVTWNWEHVEKEARHDPNPNP